MVFHDLHGEEILIGDLLAYPIWQGNTTHWRGGTVVGFGRHHILLLRKGAEVRLYHTGLASVIDPRPVFQESVWA